MTLARLPAALLFSAATFSAGIQAQTTEKGANGSTGPTAPPTMLIKPGRDPMQPIDSEYTKKIHEYTTEPFFLSPLVDYLPASSTVPTPKAVLGDIAGARNNLPYSKEVYAYFRMLENDGGQSFSVTNVLETRGGRLADSATARATGRGTAEDSDIPQGRAVLDPRNEAPKRKPVQPWQAAPVTEEQERFPLTIIPPTMRPRVVLRFADQRNLLVSGLLDGNDVAQRPVVVDVPSGKGHVILMGNNAFWRGYTIGSYFLVFNTMLSYDALDAGRKLDAK